MAQGGTRFSANYGLDVISSRLSSILKKNSHTPSSVSCSINCQLPSNQNSVSANRLPSELSSNQSTNVCSSLRAHRQRGHTSDSNHSQLTSSDSGVSCKYGHYLSSSAEDTNSSDSRENNSVGSNNTANKRHMYPNSESVENYTIPSKYKCSANQANTSYDVDYTTDRRSFIQHQQLLSPLSSDGKDDRDSYPEYLPSQSHSKVEVIRSRCYPSKHHEVDHNFDTQSSISLVDERSDTESHPYCTAFQDSSAVRRVAHTITMIAKFAACNTGYKNKTIKTCLVLWMVFTITSLVTLGVLISMRLNQQTDQVCPLCKEIIEQAKRLNGAHMFDSAFKEYLKENDKDGRCCLDHTFIIKLMAQINSTPLESLENKTETIMQILRNSAKAAVHLQSMPFNYKLPGEMMIRWNLEDMEDFNSVWDKPETDTEIQIPVDGVYYIYATVQYINPKNASGLDQNETFPLTVSLRKRSPPETLRFIIRKVSIQCTYSSLHIEHNISIQKLVRLSEGDKVSLVVSNWHILNTASKMHQIGLFKVN
ncbi:hypothetical protein ACJMK2_018816 [Sinanodonta woodiana]|uniref:THD domain-containing protein n=1 Tax=Sinanodonta woodiana TaxID=1069815 RepID=A0ABD3UEI7_SINWO